MGNVTEEKWIEMLEKKADGNYVAKYPKVKSKSGVTFDEHLAEKATLDKLGHVKAETTADGTLIIPEPDIPKSNYNAERFPNESDDILEGYARGSVWIVPSIPEIFICTDNTEGNSVWERSLQWSSFIQQFYNEGDERHPVTGGWVEGYMDGGFAEKNPNYFYLEATSRDAQSTLVTDEPINLTGLSSIVVDWRNTGADTTYTASHISVSKNKMTGEDDYTARKTIEKNFSRQTTELDVSELKGDYYIKIIAYGSGSTGRSKLYVYNVRGEII